MTKLILDPSNLDLDCPKASVSNIYRVRVLGQVLEYLESKAALVLTRVPNIPELRTYICLDGEAEYHRSLEVTILNVLPTINSECIRVGSLVFVTGYYDGEDLNVIECYPIKSTSIIPEETINTLLAVSKLDDIE